MANRAHVLLLCLLSGTASLAQPARDSLVCFTVSEAYEILDTLHSGIDHRRARQILSVMYAKQVGITRSLQVDVDSLKAWRTDDHQVTAEAIRLRDQAVSDAAFWKRKANARGWRAFFAGLILGGGAGYGANELRP
jgi:hypothetical protein